MKDRIRYYVEFTDDFYVSRDKYRLPDNYRWIKTDVKSKFLSALIYGLALLFSCIWCRLFLHVRIKGKRKLHTNGGIFLYGNHTQPVGDVFNPALCCFPKRIYTIAASENMALPYLGKILPYLGALPIPSTLAGMKRFTSAIENRLNNGACIVVYPEAHVWDYCTFVRPFPVTSFKYPVKSRKPAFCMTAVYKKRRFGKKPSMLLYIDGPFFTDKTGSAGAEELRDRIYDCMKSRCCLSDENYVEYRKLKTEEADETAE